MGLKVACVGAGYFSQFHVGSWRRIERVTLVGMCDQDIARAKASGAPAYAEVATMLGETGPDILDIILPPPGHAETIQAGIDAGVSAIICQKPFCRDLAEAETMANLAADAGIPLIVHENFRFQPWFRKIKALLNDGVIGDVFQVTFRLRPGDGQGRDAYMDRQPAFRDMPRFLIHETGVHYIDVFRYLLGEPVHVYADLRQINPAIAGEDAGIVIFEHANGIRAILDGNRNADHATDNTRRTMGEGLIEGAKGTLTLSGNGAIQFRGFGDTTIKTVVPPDEHDGFGGDCAHILQSHVVSGLLDGQPFENTASDYLRVIRVKEAIYKSHMTQKKVEL